MGGFTGRLGTSDSQLGEIELGLGVATLSLGTAAPSSSSSLALAATSILTLGAASGVASAELSLTGVVTFLKIRHAGIWHNVVPEIRHAGKWVPSSLSPA